MLNTTDLPRLWQVAAFHRRRAEKASAEFGELLESMSPGEHPAKKNRRNVLLAIHAKSLCAWARVLDRIEEIIETGESYDDQNQIGH